MQTSPPKGFSLLEVLTVLAIASLLLASVSLSLGQSQLRQLEMEKKKLALLIQATTSRSATLGIDHTILISEHGLRFYEHRNGLLEELKTPPFQPRPWPKGMSVQVEGSRELRAGSIGLFSPAVIRLELAGSHTRAVFDAMGRLQ